MSNLSTILSSLQARLEDAFSISSFFFGEIPDLDENLTYPLCFIALTRKYQPKSSNIEFLEYGIKLVLIGDSNTQKRSLEALEEMNLIDSSLRKEILLWEQEEYQVLGNIKGAISDIESVGMEKLDSGETGSISSNRYRVSISFSLQIRSDK